MKPKIRLVAASLVISLLISMSSFGIPYATNGKAAMAFDANQLNKAWRILRSIASLNNSEIRFLVDTAYDILDYTDGTSNSVITSAQWDLLNQKELTVTDLQEAVGYIDQFFVDDAKITAFRQDVNNGNIENMINLVEDLKSSFSQDFKKRITAKGLNMDDIILIALDFTGLTVDTLNVTTELKTSVEDILSNRGVFEVADKATLASYGINWQIFNQLITKITNDGNADKLLAVIQKLLGYTAPSDGNGGGGGGGILVTGNSSTISATVGGSLSFSGLKVDIPANALPGDATLSIKKLSTTEVDSVVSSGLRLKLGSDVYEIDTTGSKNFNMYITIRLPFDPAKIAEDEQPVVYYFDGTEWVEIVGTVEGNEVVVKVNHLTKFAVFSTKATVTFADIAGHWAQQEIESMLAMGLVNGVSATEFEPERSITRAEFAALLVRALGIQSDVGLSSNFADVASDAWYSAVVVAATENGLVNGYSSATFGPEDVITREQMAVMVVRALKYAGKEASLTENEVDVKLAIFDDKQDISAWAQEGVAGAVAKSIVKGRTDSTFVPQGTATRAEAAVMILRMHNQL